MPLRYNNVHSRLAAALTNVATTITLESALQEGGVNVPTLAGGNIILLGIDDEIVSLTAYTAGATTGTITRGYGNTLAAAHTTGATVANVISKGDVAPGTSVTGSRGGNAALASLLTALAAQGMIVDSTTA